MEVGSPPLARGIRLFQFLDRTERGITPACAGNTIIVIQYWKFRLDHPRLRGEYGSRRLYALGFRGSPPLARGILYNLIRFAVCTMDHPRLRGEYQPKTDCRINGIGSPPLARGIH